MSITAIDGVRVGHWTDPVALTGCTVIVPPSPNVAAVDVRGSAPGSRELALLGAGKTVQEVSAIVLSGGSAFGLAAADGVMASCEAEGRGFVTAGGVVPIVPAAVIFDLAVGTGSARPGPEAGRLAYESASNAPVGSGRIGAGAGATVAKWRGPDHMRWGGLGSGLVEVGGVRVGALTVVNAVGDVYGQDGRPLTGGPGRGASMPSASGSELTNTTLSCVITDAPADRLSLQRLALRAHDAFGVMISPVHTRFDGDTVFVVSTQAGNDVDEEVLGEATLRAVCLSIEAAVGSAKLVRR